MVSPYLGTHGLYSRDGMNLHCSSCLLGIREVSLLFCTLGFLSSSNAAFFPEKHLLHSGISKSRNVIANKNAVVRSKSYNVPMLTPVAEYAAEASAGGGASCVRRHSFSEIASCLEESGSLVESTTSTAEAGSTSSLLKHSPASTTSGGCTGGWARGIQNQILMT